jgi:ABC-type uncharacterized transport system permease subunit
MITLLSTWTFGLALALVALGVFVSYKLFSFPDITTDGSFALGAVVTAVLLTAGVDPLLATLGGMAAGGLAGCTTALLHASLGIERLLAGILVTTALASVNLVVLGRSNVPLSATHTLLDRAEATLAPALEQAGISVAVAGEAAQLIFMITIVAVAIVALWAVAQFILASWQWRRPNQTIPLFMIALLVYRLGDRGLEAIADPSRFTALAGVTLGLLLVCLWLHVVAVRGAARLAALRRSA